MKRFLSILLGFVLTASAALAIDSRSALTTVLKTCEISFKLSGGAFPCLKVSEGADPLLSYAVLREPMASQRTIFSPLAEIPGIEDPRLLGPGAPNFFSMAWNERSLAVPEGRDQWDGVALAINAAVNRTQDHLHIHMGCLAPKVTAALAKTKVSSIEFRRLGIKLERQTYWALFVPADDLSGINPFKLVADQVFLAKRFMGGVTIGVIGGERDGQRGFFILANAMGPKSGHDASAESLIDPSCG
ncbi:CDP-diacylglycerol diphosphatase [Rhizobium sp. BE258]|uniref:CDP-diacylglycerol diphosphatase n=1 Tax=Rhizobium sp. BE258 TaxID=2817722 RepID=UPI002859ECEE|nr:CDP-diacylglycerol diphosphatase [Rhizobium sp. BE258]MDR7145195.1 CDP-diacylglycerol pyrophosphatase [Rhizobium sp. BE258]